MTENRFLFRTEGGFPFDVRSLRVSEGMSRPFVVSMVGLSDDGDPDFELLIGSRASLSIEGVPRAMWTGRIVELAMLPDDEPSRSSYELHLASELWLLTLRRNHRVFEAVSEVDAALAILRAWDLPCELRLDRASFKRREVLVQYAESDFSFFSRMLERAGVSYWFEPTEAGSQLVLADRPTAQRASLAVPHRELQGATDASAWGVQIARTLRAGRYTIGDVDFRRPTDRQPIVGALAEDATDFEASLERFHHVQGSMSFEVDGASEDLADQRLLARTDESEARRRVGDRLASKRTSALGVRLATTAMDLSPGSTFTLVGHPSPLLVEPLLVLGSTLEAEIDQTLVRRIDAVSTSMPFAPPLETPAPVVRGVELATVVGVRGDEIPVDEFSRVRVHFHWNRESEMDDRSFAWLQVGSAWAGGGFGAINPPRVGQEVIVTFMDGDADRPIVTGRLYTKDVPVPYPLPENKTQSGWKTRTTSNGAGYNELMFEDKAGAELVRMRAERNLATRVNNDERRTVENDRTTQVGGNETRTIGGDRTRQVEGNVTKSVFGPSDSIVSGDSSSYMNKSFRDTTGGGKATFVGGSRKVEVAGKAEHTQADADDGAGHFFKITDSNAEFGLFMEKNRIELYAFKNSVFRLVNAHVVIQTQHVTTAAETAQTFLGDEATITAIRGAISGADAVVLEGGPIHLQRDGFGAGRLGHLAPATIDEGCAKILVGGPSLPGKVIRFGPKVIELDNGIVLDARKWHESQDTDGDGKTEDVYTNTTDEEAQDFLGDAMAELARLNQTETGRKALEDIAKSKKKVTITPTRDQNGYSGAKDGKTMQNGAGSDSTIKWNPYFDDGPPGMTEEERRKMPGRVLGHEVGHSRNSAQGRNRVNDPTGNLPNPDYDNWEEYQTIQDENQWLRENDLPYRRIDHHSGWEKRMSDGTWATWDPKTQQWLPKK